MEILKVPQGNFKLSRYPIRKKESLRAWDAADEYILRYLYENQIVSNKSKILIVNDTFATLSVILSIYQPVCWSDSVLSKRALSVNLKSNKLVDEVTFKASTQIIEDDFDLVLIKIPKSNALLEDQLAQLTSVINEDTVIISAAMARNIHTSTLQIFEEILGKTKTSLAVKKARLVFSCFDKQQVVKSAYPKKYYLEELGFEINNHANVFSRNKLDIGTRFLLTHIPADINYETIVDLGCGNGIVGIMAKKMNSSSRIIFTDESYMAVESAKLNFLKLYSSDQGDFIVTNIAEGIDDESVDLVLNNPPFHQQHTTGDQIAFDMFKQARRILKRGGIMRVIGNRHLGYHVKLKKIFGNCEVIASNKKFVILESTR